MMTMTVTTMMGVMGVIKRILYIGSCIIAALLGFVASQSIRLYPTCYVDREIFTVTSEKMDTFDFAQYNIEKARFRAGTYKYYNMIPDGFVFRSSSTNIGIISMADHQEELSWMKTENEASLLKELEEL